MVGKRELGQQNTLDLVVLLLIANAVQNAIIGNDNSFSGAVISVATLVVLNETLNRVVFFSERLGRLFDGSEAYLIRDGKPVVRELFRAGISLPQLRSIARRQGYADLSEVHAAILEANGVVSMFTESTSCPESQTQSSLEDVHGAGGNQENRDRRERGLRSHQRFGLARERHGVSRAKGNRVGKRQIGVIPQAR